MKHLFLSLLALVGHSVPAVAQKALPQEEILTNGDPTFGSAFKPGKRDGNKTVITPEILRILRSGSSSDIRTILSPAAGNVLWTLLNRLSERPSVLDYGVDMTGAADSTAALVSALNSGKAVTAPCGTIRLVSTVAISVKAHFTGAGPCTRLIYDAPVGSPAAPMLDVRATAEGTILDSFEFDHQAHFKRFAMTKGAIGGSALLIQADNVFLSRLIGRHGWDNCISFTKLGDDGVSVPGKPWYYSARTIRTFSCGEGPLHAGAGIDVASSRWGTISDFTDDGSYSGFIQDIGAAANGVFSDFNLINTRFDGKIDSFAMYIGAGDSVYSNIRISDARHTGVWIDHYATNVVMNNITINGTHRDAMWVRSPRATISNLLIDNIGFNRSSAASGVRIDSSAGAIDSLYFINPIIRSTNSRALRGFYQTGEKPLSGAILNADVAATTPYAITSPTFGITDAKAVSAGWTAYTPTITCDVGAPASASASGSSRRVGKTVEVQVNVLLAKAGTCSGRVLFTLPHKAASRTALSGSETKNSGYALSVPVYEGDNKAVILRYDGTTPVATGNLFAVGGVYQAK